MDAVWAFVSAAMFAGGYGLGWWAWRARHEALVQRYADRILCLSEQHGRDLDDLAADRDALQRQLAARRAKPEPEEFGW